MITKPKLTPFEQAKAILYYRELSKQLYIARKQNEKKNIIIYDEFQMINGEANYIKTTIKNEGTKQDTSSKRRFGKTSYKGFIWCFRFWFWLFFLSFFISFLLYYAKTEQVAQYLVSYL